MSSHTVLTCHGGHMTKNHKCFGCGEIGGTHDFWQCPKKCTVMGCDDIFPHEHPCCNCGKVNQDHHWTKCPNIPNRKKEYEEEQRKRDEFEKKCHQHKIAQGVVFPNENDIYQNIFLE